MAARRRAYEEDPRWPTKAVLRVSGTIFAAVATGLFAASIAATNANFINLSGPGDWNDGLALAPVVLALLYNPLTLFHHLVLRDGKPAHPALHVAVDLLLWAMLVPSIIVAVGGGIFWYWTAGVPSTNNGGVIDCGFSFNAFAPECSPVAYSIGRMEIAGIVFAFLLFVIHLVLFVFASLDLHRRRVAARMGFNGHNFDFQMRKDSEQASQSS